LNSQVSVPMKIKNLFLVLLIPYSLFSSAFNSYETQAILELKKLVNYSELSANDSACFIQQRVLQLIQQEELDIPRRFLIPIELMSFRREGQSSYYIRYNTGKNEAIGYVPSDLVIHYEREAFSDFMVNGQESPLLSIILAQQYTESAFNPLMLGDGGKSLGLPQLYRPTAEWICKIDPELWGKYIGWNSNGTHYFTSLAAQIRFPYDFLPKYKHYSSENKFEGLRRYNGAGKKAENYARLVIKRSIVYLELMQQYKYFQEDTAHLIDKMANVINMGIVLKGETQLSKEQVASIAHEVMGEFSRNWNYIKRSAQMNLNIIEGKGATFELSQNYKVPSDGNIYYILIEEGRSLFSYFHNTQEMLNTLNHSNNKEYYLYYLNKGKEIRITAKEQMQGNAFFTNAKAGNIIYIPPGTKIYSPKSNLISKVL